MVEPTWWACPEYEFTLGPEVAEVNAMAGYAPDPEQEMLLDGTFGVAANGRAAAFEIDVVAARQQLKTGFEIQAMIGWLFVTEEQLIVYSAHELRAAEETWRTMANLIESTPALSRQLLASRGDRPGISEGAGRWAINLADGRRCIFMTRGKNTGRALAGNKVVIDEGFAATPEQLGSLLPVLTSKPDPQYIIGSSAGKLNSTVLRDARDRGRNGGSDRQLYGEWGDRDAGKGCELAEHCDHEKTTKGCVFDDEQRWATIMPQLGHRTAVETIRGLRQALPATEFGREFMVWWDVEGDGKPPAMSSVDWQNRKNVKAKQPKRATVFLDVAPDRRSGCIGVAARGRKDRTLVMVKHAAGTSWMVPALEKLMKKREIVEVALYPGSQASTLIAALTKAGIEFVTITRNDAGDATAGFIDGVKADGDHHIEHVGQKVLDDAVGNATTIYTGETEQWFRRDFDGADISPVVAAAGAAYRWGVLAASDYDTEDSYL